MIGKLLAPEAAAEKPSALSAVRVITGELADEIPVTIARSEPFTKTTSFKRTIVAAAVAAVNAAVAASPAIVAIVPACSWCKRSSSQYCTSSFAATALVAPTN